MRKIIYNTKLKKLLIALLLVILLFNFIFPNVGLAVAAIVAGNKATGSIQEILDSMTTISNTGASTSADKKTIKDYANVKEENIQALKTTVINAIKGKFSNLEESLYENIYKDYKNNAEKIEVTCILNMAGVAAGGTASISKFEVTVNLLQDDINATQEKIANGTPIEDVNTEDKQEISNSAAAGQDGGTTESGSNYEGLETADNAFGFMLEPIVALATFLADTLMTILSTFMTQTEFEFVMTNDVSKVPDLGEHGATYTISDMQPYTNVFQVIDIEFPNFKYSPEEIFSGNIDLLNVNFIQKSNDDTNWNKIRNGISSWYKVARMIAIIGLLSVLIYTGIRIILTSNAKDKAKYKELIINWFIGVVLAFSMHYIMAFILNVIQEIQSLLQGVTGAIQVDAGGTVFETNLIGLARFLLQQRKLSAKVGYLVMYIALITYTFKFTFLYLKRVLKMAFLTILSPVVALTYPIDKANDGKAQGFEMWLKEFMYNALLQPLHYILYYILVTTSLSLAANNLIYGIAALMFISQAEKLLKRIFGFGKAKAGTVGGIAGAFATGAITGTVTNMARDPMHPLNALIGGKSSGGKSSSGGSQNQLGDGYNEDNELAGVMDDTNFDDYLGTDMRLDYRTRDYSSSSDTTTRMPLVDDFISRYRQGIPETELGEVSFNDGYGSMKSLMREIEQCERKLADPNISDADREKYQQKLTKCKTALQKRLTDNEAGFNNTGIPLQYNDGDRRSNSELMDEIMRLRKLSTDRNLSQKERDSYGAEYKRLYKRLKKRMAENQYIQRQGGPNALLEQERFRMLSSTMNQEGGENNPIVNGYIGPGARLNGVGGQRYNQDGAQPRNQTNRGVNQNQQNQTPPGARQNQQNQTTPEARQTQQNQTTQTTSQNQTNPVNSTRNRSTNNSTNQQSNVNNGNSQNGRAMTQAEIKRAKRVEERKAAIESFKNARVTKGLTHVGKTIIKPAWDVEKSTSYNATRLVGNLARTLAGVTVGVTAAAVQAGISITDGNYKPMEGAATFGAGFIGVSYIAGKAGGLADTYRQAAYSGEDQESLEKYGEQWFNREDIISNYNREFPGQGKLMRQRAVKNYVSRGITDFKEQKQAIKFAEQLKKERGMSEEQADWIAAGTLRYRQNLVNNNNYEILFDSKSREKYLDTKASSYSDSASKDAIRRKHEEFLQNIMDFDRANR